MTPKEKALELIERFYLNVGGLENKKQCALITVDEIIRYLPNINNTPPGHRNAECFYYQYWVDVKKEIQKL